MWRYLPEFEWLFVIKIIFQEFLGSISGAKFPPQVYEMQLKWLAMKVLKENL